MSGAASVTIKEIDLSTRVASFEGVYAAIVIPAKKGQTNAKLMGSDTELLANFTPNEEVGVGYDFSYYSALAYLERANKLWVKRVVNGATFAGVAIMEKDATGNSVAISGEDLESASAHTMGAEEALFLYAKNVGAWGNDIGVKIETIEDNPDLYEPNSFKISVFKKGNEATPVEEFIVSRVLGQKNGRNQNMFVEDMLEASAYIGAISNPVIDDEVLPKSQSTVLYFGDGGDGLAITDSNMIAAADAFKNPNDLPVTLLLDGGYSVPSYGLALTAIAQNRQDCVAILTTPYEKEVHNDYLNEIVTYRKDELNINSSYAALYTPHVQITDKFNDRKIWIAPDGHVAGSISWSSQNYEIWYPPAGFRRGVLLVEDVTRRFEDGQLDYLYNNGINPIKFFSGKGIVVWGQKTLLARASALDRLNVRLLLIVIEPAIKEFLENFLFEFNDEGTRQTIETRIEEYLEDIQARKGLQDFDVICNDTNNTPAVIDANKLVCDIYIKPMRSVEDIPVRVVITPTGISFSDAAAAV